LLRGKKAVLVLAHAGAYIPGPSTSMDFIGTYLKAVLRFIGTTGVEIVLAEVWGSRPSSTFRAEPYRRNRSV